MPARRRFFSAAPLLAGTCALVLSSPAAAITGSFLPLGPDGGSIDALAVDPLDPLTVYAGANPGGVFKSSDGGQTWAAARNGIPPEADVLSLAVDPLRHATLYAGTNGLGVYASTDGGASWSPRSQGLNPQGIRISALAVGPGSPGTVLAGTDVGAFRSPDGGATWALANQGFPEQTPRQPFPPRVRALAVDRSLPAARVYASVEARGVYKSVDGGKSWSAASHGLPFGLGADALAISPDGVIYAAFSAHGVYRSTDGGAHWAMASHGLEGFLFQGLAVDPAAPGTLVAATATGALRSEDRGATWTDANDGLASRAVLTVTPAPQGGTFYAGTSSQTDGSPGGVYQSADGGRTWQRRSQGISALFVTAMAVEPTSPATLWVIASSSGLYRSGDGGSSWSQVDPGVPEPVLGLATDPLRPGRVYVVANTAGGPALLATADSGKTWTRFLLPSLGFVTPDPRTDSLFLSGVFGVYRSVDGGRTWTAAAGEIAADTILRIVPDLSTPGVLYAAGRRPGGPITNPSQARVFKSTDGGATWARSDAGLENVFSLDQLVVLPNAPATLYAVGDNNTFFRSRNAGASWERVTQLQSTVVRALAAGPDGTLFAATDRMGLLASADGQTWSPVSGVPAPLDLFTLRLDPNNPHLLYVGTSSLGLQALAIAAPSVCAAGATALCLQGHRFQVEVAWSDFTGNTGAGQAVPGIDPTGSFWFFDPGNTELVVKVLDGRGLNNHFWVFYASLTNVAYTLTVTDTETGAVRIYKNPLGHFGSAGDTEAF